jgi:hypothetical protein
MLLRDCGPYRSTAESTVVEKGHMRIPKDKKGITERPVPGRLSRLPSIMVNITQSTSDGSM